MSIDQPKTNNDVAIKVEHVSKKYCKSLKRSMLYGVKDIARNALSLSSDSEQLRKSEFWAVDDISFEVKKRETLGIIGPNGSGKTTILKMLNGIFWPDKGKIIIKGKVGALIEVGAGFHPILTGRENIYVNGAILGMSKREIDKKFDSIVEFADIGDFIDTPVKFYSSGMFVRLGFAIAVHCEPEILLIDEVLAVGDFAFQAKCFNRINQLKASGVTTIFVSHNLGRIRQYCDRALLLSQGHTVRVGPVEKVCEHYVHLVQESMDKEESKENMTAIRSSGLFGPILLDSPVVKNVQFKLVDKIGNRIDKLRTGDSVAFQFSFELTKEVANLNIGMPFSREDGLLMTGMSTRRDRVKLSKAKGRIFGELRIPKFTFYPGRYIAALTILDRAEFLYRNPSSPFTVEYEKEFTGLFAIEYTWDIRKLE